MIRINRIFSIGNDYVPGSQGSFYWELWIFTMLTGMQWQNGTGLPQSFTPGLINDEIAISKFDV